MNDQVDEDCLTRATRAVEELYLIRETYFPVNPDDKISLLQEKSDLSLKLLDSVSPEDRKSPLQRATYEYLRGKILDVFPEYRKEAEHHLSKAVKLNPSLADAWLCLGNCIWKKGDLHSAKNCFTLALNKGRDKTILSQLSMLERKMAQGAENEAELVEESIHHAKEAVMLDVKDGKSWYSLGNACLTSFFVTGAWNHSKLLQSLKAYQNAVSGSNTILTKIDSIRQGLAENVFGEIINGLSREKDERMKFDPDLYFNCATVNKYLENYERALTGFEAAALKDPGLNAIDEVQKMVVLLDKLEHLLRGSAKPKRLVSLASSLPDVNLNPPHKRVNVDLLLEGLNKEVAVVGKVLFFIKHENSTPLYYLVCDTNQTCFVLSVYGMLSDTIKEGDQLTLLEPYFRNFNFSWKGKHYDFKSIRVDFLEQVLVNGKCPSTQQAVRTSIFAQHKP